MAHESFEDRGRRACMNERLRRDQGRPRGAPGRRRGLHGGHPGLTGHGGWPMTVLRSRPTGEPFFAGTYFPPAAAGCRRSRSSSPRSAEAWTEPPRRGARHGGRGRRRAAARRPSRSRGGARSTGDDARRGGRRLAGRHFDAAHGGFGGAPKFPPSMVLEFLLRHHARTGDADALADGRRAPARRWPAAACTTSSPAASRATPSTPAGWCRTSRRCCTTTPCCCGVYVHWWRADRRRRWPSGSPGETADFLLRDLRTAEGGFASALDADTDGRRGPDLRLDAGPAASRCSATRTAPGPPSCSTSPTRGTFEHGTSTLQLRADPDDAGAGGRRSAARLLAARRTRARSRPATTRSWPPGTGWPSPRSPRPAPCSSEPRCVDAARRVRRLARCDPPRRRPAAPRLPRRRRRLAMAACSRTTATWPRACSRCTRRPATPRWLGDAGAAARRRARALRRRATAASTTPPTTPRQLFARPADHADNADPVGPVRDRRGSADLRRAHRVGPPPRGRRGRAAPRPAPWPRATRASPAGRWPWPRRRWPARCRWRSSATDDEADALLAVARRSPSPGLVARVRRPRRRRACRCSPSAPWCGAAPRPTCAGGSSATGR